MGCPMLPPKPPKPPPPKPPKQPPPPPAASSHADPAPKVDTRSPVSVGTVCEILSVRFRAHWQTHRKHRALARLARHGHVAPHHARELAREGKAEPRPAIAPRGQGIGLGEVLEQFRLLLRRHADAAIRDGKLDPATAIRHLAHPQGNFALFRKLAGIA